MGFFSSIRKIFRQENEEDSTQALDAQQAHQEEGSTLPSELSEKVAPAPYGVPAVAPETTTTPAGSTANGHLPVSQPLIDTISAGETVISGPSAAEASTAVTPASAQGNSDGNAALSLALRHAEPKLSAWLGIVLEGVTNANDLLWERLGFLLSSLDAPKDEAEQFINTFKKWLRTMGYEDISDFRSELQYRLALALDLEDEEDERSRLVLKFTEGLAKTRAQLARGLNALFVSGRMLDDAFWEELEETLLMADVGVTASVELTKRLRQKALEKGVKDASELRGILKEELIKVFKPVRRIVAVNPPEVILVIGVNGAGKTTTIAKLSHREQLKGRKVMLVAGDTFRAAATEQLGVWAERTGASFYCKEHGADPAAVAYEALDKALGEAVEAVFVDTAGRLQTKTNLMEELGKVRRVLAKRHPGAPHRTILVLDATTGQNALSQVKLFNEVCPVDDIILTKLDGTAKGGVAAAIALQFDIPISFIGLGEKMEDLRPFEAEPFVTALLGDENDAARTK